MNNRVVITDCGDCGHCFPGSNEEYVCTLKRCTGLGASTLRVDPKPIPDWCPHPGLVKGNIDEKNKTN